MIAKPESIKAHGSVRDGRVVFVQRCPIRHCELKSTVVFNQAMRKLEASACSHFINYDLRPKDGVYFTYIQE